jgi:hypothetical protein
MNETRIVVSQFCDDVRHEFGNKISLMGCYGDEMLFDKLPALLPKLCIHMRAITLLDKPFTKLTFRAFQGPDLIAEINVPTEQLVIPQNIEKRSDARRIGVMVVMAVSPLVVNELCVIRTEAECEEGILDGSPIYLREKTDKDI